MHNAPVLGTLMAVVEPIKVGEDVERDWFD
jgi:hypothetical protein